MAVLDVERCLLKTGGLGLKKNKRMRSKKQGYRIACNSVCKSFSKSAALRKTCRRFAWFLFMENQYTASSCL